MALVFLSLFSLSSSGFTGLVILPTGSSFFFFFFSPHLLSPENPQASAMGKLEGS